jgi:hypothetical protein
VPETAQERPIDVAHEHLPGADDSAAAVVLEQPVSAQRGVDRDHAGGALGHDRGVARHDVRGAAHRLSLPPGPARAATRTPCAATKKP